MADIDPEMFKVQYRIGHLIHALHKLASGSPPKWTRSQLEGIYGEVYGTPDAPAPTELPPDDPKTWDILCGFASGKRNNAGVYVVRPGQDRPVRNPIQAVHLQRLARLLANLGLIADDPTFDFEGPTSGWWDFLDAAWEAVSPNVPPPEPGLSKFAQIVGAPDSLLDDFVGRDDLLALISAKLGQITGKPQTTRVALHGLGGVGKTRLAAEFAYTNAGRYGPILFIDAHASESLEANIQETVRTLQQEIGLSPIDPKVAIRQLAVWLEEHPRWLLILDNVDTDEAAAAVQALLPILRGGHIIITTRLPHWYVESRIIPIHVGELTPADSATYLRKATEDRSARLASDEADMLALVESLGGVPSLLTYAAGYIKHGTTFRDYHLRWKTKRADKNSWWREGMSQNVTGYPSPQAATTWQTSVDILRSADRSLLERLAWFAPDRIPTSAVTDRIELDELAGYSLITFVHGDAFTMNSALQEITRINLQATGQFESIFAAATTLEAALKAGKKHLLPHVLSVLHFLRDDRFVEFAAADLLDSMGRMAVLALAEATSEKTRHARILATTLSDFYEVEPLVPILKELVVHELWPELQPQLLAANNYVLRYGMAEAIAEHWEVARVIKLFSQNEELNAFELGGYALQLVFAKDPSLICAHADCLIRLSERREYSGRSILGDLFLNIVFRDDLEISKSIQSLATNRFWQPIWQFIQLDVEAIEAAQQFMKMRSIPLSADPDVKGTCPKGTVNVFAEIDRVRVRLLEMRELGKQTKEFVSNYFQLGDDPSQMRYAKDELATLSAQQLAQVISLFFSHPIWAVAEAAATVLSTLAEEDPTRREERLDIISQLLVRERVGSQDPPDAAAPSGASWRIQFGANEAAFAVRHLRPATFHESVLKHYDHPICKIRGLCAENLLSHMLNSGSQTRNKLFHQFKEQITAWVSDTDCWVLEHVFRFFNTIERRNIALIETVDGAQAQVDPMVLAKDAPLLKDFEGWWKVERTRFLCDIETAKEAAGS